MSDKESASTSAKQNWDGKLADVRSFAAQNVRWPSTNSDDATEKSLAQWWARQKYYFKRYESSEKSSGIDDDRARTIRKLLSDFAAFERDGIWVSRFNRIKSQVSTAGKIWSYKIEKDSEEAKTLRWWNQQKTFYRQWRRGDANGGMTEERARKVEEILTMLGQPLATSDTPTGAPMTSGKSSST